jgi:hypothetical protein
MFSRIRISGRANSDRAPVRSAFAYPPYGMTRMVGESVLALFVRSNHFRTVFLCEFEHSLQIAQK